MSDDWQPLEGVDLQFSLLLQPLIGTLMLADQQTEALVVLIQEIATTYMAYDQQHERIMNIIQHSLVDFHGKPYM